MDEIEQACNELAETIRGVVSRGSLGWGVTETDTELIALSLEKFAKAIRQETERPHDTCCHDS